MSRERQWMPMFWGDHLADTAHFTNAEQGSYLLLIAFYWTNGGLPQDEEAIRRIAKASTHQWKKMRPVLVQKFLPGWKHKRIEEELAKSLEKSKKNSANAKRSHNDRKANADVSQPHYTTLHHTTDSGGGGQATPAKTENWWEKLPGGPLAHQIATVCGQREEFEFSGWRGCTEIVRKWLDAGWQPDAILSSVKSQLAEKPDGPPNSAAYFEKGIARHIAVLKRPLPVVIELPAQTVGVTHGKVSRHREPWQIRRDEHYEALAELDASIEADERAAAERAARSGEEGGVEIIPPAAEIQRR